MDRSSLPAPELGEVRSFWERNPVAAAAVPYQLGTPEYFEHYDRLREANEPVAESARLHEYGTFAGKRVLDVGCGNGYVLSRYARAGADANGVDLTAAAIALSTRRFEQVQLPGHFTQGSAEALPYRSETFDCVCSMGVLHHTPDTERAVSEIHRVLRPSGLLIIMLYHRGSALYRSFQFLSRIGGRRADELVNEVDGAGNPKGDVYSRAEVRDLLSGFDDLELSVGVLKGWMILPRGGRLIPNRLLGPLASRWGWFLYAKGRKPA